MRLHIPFLAAWSITCAVLLPASPGLAQNLVPSRNLELLSHQVTSAATYSACWSYVHPDGREYAVLGTSDGTAIYNITDPTLPIPVGFFPGVPSIWREMKSYRTWIYVVTEGAGLVGGLPTGSVGIQIISMANPDVPLLAGTYSTGFVSAHTVSVDTSRALLVCNGTRSTTGSATGMRILSLANPAAPTLLATWPSGPGSDPSFSQYVHDCVLAGNRLYAACIYAGFERVLDITNPSAPSEIAGWSYSGAFTHNSWPDDTGKWLYVTDEVNGEPLKIFDISNLASPVLYNTITCNPDAIVHNAHVLGNELYLANYTEGIRILDITDPAHPAEFAWADTYPGSSGGEDGAWEVCPYFPSGTVIASDIETGFYIFRPIRNYGTLRVLVIDGATRQPLAGAKVTISIQNESLTTPQDGIVQFAPNPGTYILTAQHSGYPTATTTRTVLLGSREIVTMALGTTVDVAPVAAPARLAFQDPRPNPARGAATFTLDLPAAGEARVELRDLAGRAVRTLFRGHAAAGTLSLVWDGADAGGRAAPAGLYFATAESGGQRAQARLVRVRN